MKLGRAFKYTLLLSGALDASAHAQSQTFSPAAAAAAPADPATASANADQANADIVVTAQFRATNLQDTPLAISAVTGATLAARGLTDVQQIASTAPSVTLTPGPAAFGKTTISYIRGVGANDFNPAFDPSVGFYVDDIYYASLAGSTFDLLDLERIEILRGPQGTLFGKNTIGGAIRLISKKPNGVLGGYVEATTGSYGRVDIRGSINVPIIGDDLAIRLSALHRERRGYVKRIDFVCANPSLSGTLPKQTSDSDCVVGHEGGENIEAYRAALRAVPASGLEINLIGDYTDDHSDPGAYRITQVGPDAVLNGPGNPAAGVFPINTYQNIPRFGIPYDARFIPTDRYTTYATYGNPLTGEYFKPEARVRNWGVSGTVDFDLADHVKLRSITGYRDLLSRFAYDSDGSPLGLVSQINEVDYRQFSQEAQLIGTSFGDALDWVVGGYYFHGKASYNTVTDLVVAGLYLPSADRFKIEDFSGFVHLTAHLTDKLNLIGGVRYTRETKDFTLAHSFNAYLPGGTGARVFLFPLDFTAPRLKYSSWDPKVSLDYHVTDDVMFYAQYSTGFRGGGFNNRPFTPAQVFSVEPESLDAYELGVKSQFFDRALTVNLTVFQSNYSNIQQVVAGADTTGTAFAAPLNVGDARIRGIELESGLNIGGLNLSVVANYLDAVITKGRAPGGGLVVPAAFLPQKGTRLPFAPEWRLNVGAQYTANLGNLGSLTPRIDVSYQTKIKYDSTTSPLSVEPGYAVVNGRLTWDYRPDIRLSLGVTNVFDKYYNTFIFNTYAQNLGSLAVSPSRPREWSLTLHKTF